MKANHQHVGNVRAELMFSTERTVTTSHTEALDLTLSSDLLDKTVSTETQQQHQISQLTPFWEESPRIPSVELSG